MPTFVWEGRTSTGEIRKGDIKAESEQAAVGKLRALDIAAIRIKKKGFDLNITLGAPVKTKDLVVFTRQFATMINAGLPLVQCLNILSSTTDNKRFAKILEDVKGHVESGGTFSEALARHPRVFNPLFINLVAAGEVGGLLDTIMLRLAVHIEKILKLRRRVKSAMIYPAVVLVVAIAIIVLMLWKVIPTFERMFGDFGGGALPAPTAFLINISHGFINNVHWIFLCVITFASGIFVFLRIEKGRFLFDKMVLKLPVMGSVIRKIVVARFTRTLGTLLSSGVPILDSLDIVSKTAGNRVVQAGILFVKDGLAEGKSLASPLEETGVFPPMVAQMIGVGEQTGALDAMLQKIADFYEDEVDVAVESMTKMLEPIMMAFLGAVVGGVVIAMYLPVFEMAGNIKTN